MALVIRLRQQGRTNRLSYRMVVTDKRTRRDGKYVEKLGWYNPFAADDKNVFVDNERLKHWLDLGALPSEKSEALLKKAAPEVYKKWKEQKLTKKKKVKK